MRIDFNSRGFAELLVDPKVQRDVHRRANAVAATAGPGFESFPTVNPRKRARAAVVPVTAQAAYDNARNNVLIRALDSGR